MDISTIKSHIKSGNFDKFYIWYVDEAETARVYRKMIAEKCGAKIVYVDTLADVFSRLRQNSLISNRTIYIIINDRDFLKNEKAWTALGDGRELKDSIVIFYYTEKDVRLKFWKNYKDRAVDFVKLEDRLLEKYIQEQIPLNEQSCKELIEICDGNYSRILMEVDKIKNYLDAVDPTSDDLTWDKGFKYLLNQGSIYKEPKDAIFDFTNAVLDRKPMRAYNYLAQSYEIGEPDMRLISVLYNNFRALLQVQTCSSNDISKSTGLNGFQIKNVKPFVNRYTDEELIHALEVLRKAEVGIKTGQMASEISVHYCLVNIL